MKYKEGSLGKALKEAGIKVEEPINAKDSQNQTKKVTKLSQTIKTRGLVQSKFLNDLKKSRKVTQFTGFQNQTWQGTISSFDDFSLKIKEKNGKELLLFKHALMAIEGSTQNLLLFKHALMMIESAETDKENTITETNQKPVSGKNAVGTQFLQKFKHNQGRVILRSFEGKSWEGFITAYDEYSIIISNKT